MKPSRFSLLAAAALPLVAACSGAVETDPISERNALAQEYNLLAGRYGTAPAVSRGNVPFSGTADYDGVMRILVDTPATTEVLGDADVDVNFGTNTVNGQFTDFYGRANGGAVQAWNGSMTANGTIANRAQVIGTTLNGSLTGATTGTTLSITNLPLNGNFRDGSTSAAVPPDSMILQSGAGNIRLNNLNYGTETGNNCETCVWVVAED